MADHLDDPGLTSPAMDARVDITDHYAFQKPGDPDRTILILNVNPLAPTHADEFRSDAVYETLVDTDGDAQPNIEAGLSPGAGAAVGVAYVAAFALLALLRIRRQDIT